MPHKYFDYGTDGFLALVLSVLMDAQFIREAVLIVLAVVVKYVLQKLFEYVEQRRGSKNKKPEANK